MLSGVIHRSTITILLRNGTIGLEIVEDLPARQSVIAEIGGGGLIAGIGSARRALKPGRESLAPNRRLPLPGTLVSAQSLRCLTPGRLIRRWCQAAEHFSAHVGAIGMVDDSSRTLDDVRRDIK